MKKVFLITVTSLLFLAIFTTLFFITKSDLYEQDYYVDISKPWVKISSGWSIRDNEEESDLITMRRTFNYAELGSLSQDKKFIEMNNPCLAFITHSQRIRVFFENEMEEEARLIYSYGFNGKSFVGNDSGNSIHIIPLPYYDVDEFSITIQLIPSYRSENLKLNKLLSNFTLCKHSVPEIFAGTKTQCIMSIKKSTNYQTFVVAIIGVLGLCFVVFSFIYGIFFKETNMSLYFFWGLFALEIALGFFCESYRGVLFSKNSLVQYFMGTILITIQPLFMSIFATARKNLNYAGKINRVFKNVSPVLTALVCVFAFIRVVPFGIVRSFVFAWFYAYAICIFISIVAEIINYKNTLVSSDICSLIAAMSIIMDMFLLLFRHERRDVFFCTRLGVLIFVLFNTVDLIVEFFRKELVKAQSQMLKKARSTDFVTGFKQGALLWNSGMKSKLESSVFSMIVANVTNIDELNSLGQSVSDEALKNFGRTLNTVFLSDNIYRLEGAKFGILLYEYEINLMDTKLKLLKNRIEDTNESSNGAKIQYKTVCASFDRDEDRDLDGFYIRILGKLRS